MGVPSPLPTPRVASCPPAPTCQPRPPAGSQPAAAWLQTGRLAPSGVSSSLWPAPSFCAPQISRSAAATSPGPDPWAQPHRPERSRSIGSATSEEQEQEEEEQEKEMINFLFPLQLGNRIAGAAGPQSSWPGGNPGRRTSQEKGAPRDRGGVTGPRVPFGVLGSPRLGEVTCSSPDWAGRCCSGTQGYPPQMSLFPLENVFLGIEKQLWGVWGEAAPAAPGDAMLPHGPGSPGGTGLPPRASRSRLAP